MRKEQIIKKLETFHKELGNIPVDKEILLQLVNVQVKEPNKLNTAGLDIEQTAMLIDFLADLENLIKFLKTGEEDNED